MANATQESPKEIRERMMLTQVEMAIRADVSLSTIQKYEAGKLPSPKPRIARKLATAYAHDAAPQSAAPAA